MRQYFLITSEQYEKLAGITLTWTTKFTAPLIFYCDSVVPYTLDDVDVFRCIWYKRSRFVGQKPANIWLSWGRGKDYKQDILEFFRTEATNLTKLGFIPSSEFDETVGSEAEAFIKDHKLFTRVKNTNYVKDGEKDRESALDIFSNTVHVGDEVAYVNMSQGQKMQVGKVTRITRTHIVVNGYAAPDKYVAKNTGKDIESAYVMGFGAGQKVKAYVNEV